MNKKRLLYSIIAILLGVFMFIFGEYDDSPGGQLLGLVIAVIGIVVLIKSRKKTSDLLNKTSQSAKKSQDGI